MSDNEAYMLQRDSIESKRLETQHELSKALAHRHLIHPSIPTLSLRAIADVGTGTGAWLKDVTQALDYYQHPELEFLGFDISSKQFPSQIDRLEFLVHDMTIPFDKRHHEHFDLANIRTPQLCFEGPAFKAGGCEYRTASAFVELPVKILITRKTAHSSYGLGPGGYIQWQEADLTDSRAILETPAAGSAVSYVRAERIARGLTLCIVTPLLKEIQSLSISLSPSHHNSVSWTNDLVRITYLETLSTQTSHSTLVRRESTNHTLSAVFQLLLAGATRRRMRAVVPSVSASERDQLKRDPDAMMALVNAFKKGEDPTTNRGDGVLTMIFGRKGVVFRVGNPWMARRHEIGAV